MLVDSHCIHAAMLQIYLDLELVESVDKMLHN